MSEEVKGTQETLPAMPPEGTPTKKGKKRGRKTDTEMVQVDRDRLAAFRYAVLKVLKFEYAWQFLMWVTPLCEAAGIAPPQRSIWRWVRSDGEGRGLYREKHITKNHDLVMRLVVKKVCPAEKICLDLPPPASGGGGERRKPSPDEKVATNSPDTVPFLEGRLFAIQHLHEVLDLIYDSPNEGVALQGLMSRFNLSEVQAIGVTGLNLRRLTHGERENLRSALGLTSPVEIMRFFSGKPAPPPPPPPPVPQPEEEEEELSEPQSDLPDIVPPSGREAFLEEVPPWLTVFASGGIGHYYFFEVAGRQQVLFSRKLGENEIKETLIGLLRDYPLGTKISYTGELKLYCEYREFPEKKR